MVSNGCFWITSPNGERICVPIYVLIEETLFVDPNPPDPLRLNLDRFRNWVVIEGVEDAASWKADVPILATINLLAANLSDGRMREQMTQAVQQANEEVSRQLPEGFHFEVPTAASVAGKH